MDEIASELSNSSRRTENMTTQRCPHRIPDYKKLWKRKVYIYELNCNIILYLVPKNNCLVINMDSNSSQYVPIMFDNEYVKIFQIYLETTSVPVNVDILCTVFHSFMLKDLDFISNLSKKSKSSEKLLKYNLLNSRNYNQIQIFEITKYYKLLHHNSMADYIIKKYLFESEWKSDCYCNEKNISLITWILKYKDYISSDSINFLNSTFNLIPNNTTSKNIIAAVKHHFIRFSHETMKTNKFKDTRMYIRAALSTEKYNKMLSHVTTLVPEIVMESFKINFFLASLKKMWQNYWNKHLVQHYHNFQLLLKEHCSMLQDFLNKIHILTSLNITKNALQIESFRKEDQDALLHHIDRAFKKSNYIFYIEIFNKSIKSKRFLEAIVFDKDHAKSYIYELESYVSSANYRFQRMPLLKFNVQNTLVLKRCESSIANKSCNVNVVYKDNLVIDFRTVQSLFEMKNILLGKNNCNYNNTNKTIIGHQKLKYKQSDYSIKIPHTCNSEENNKGNNNKSFECSSIVPVQMNKNSVLKKYWAKRYRLFSKYDDGILLDYESWFSVTPEKVAIHVAKRCKCSIIIDAFCGAGGNSIHFASTCNKVFAIDIDPIKIAMAKHNAHVYGVEDKIEFILGDFFCLSEKLTGDVVFLSPPWGGPSYIHDHIFDLQNIMQPTGGLQLLEIAKTISKNIAFYLPKNINILQLAAAVGPGCKIEIEQNFLDCKLVAVTAYYGDLLKKTEDSIITTCLF